MQSFAVFAVTCLAVAAANPIARGIYDGCGTTTTCFGVSKESGTACVDTQDCALIVAWSMEGDAYNFELQATNPENGWVGFGLSRDTSMGDDSVVICNAESGSTDLYWNVAESEEIKYPLPVGDNTGLTAGSLTNDNGIYCSFTRDASLTFVTPVDPSEEVTFDLTSEAFYILLSTGPVVDGELDQHNAVGISDDLVQF